MDSEILPPPTDSIRTIFVDSNIDTHLALGVSLYDTITDVKAKIAAEHALCFQDIGEISIQAIKVRRRGFYYNLVGSMHALNAFDGVKGSWFVCIDAVPMCTVKNQKAIPNEVTQEHQKHHAYAVPVCSVDKHQEIVFCGSSSKNSGPDGQESHNPSLDHELRPTMLIDQGKVDRRKDDGKNLGFEACERPTMLIDQGKVDRRKDDGKNLGFEACDRPSATCTHKTISSKRSKTSQQEELPEIKSQHYLVEKQRGKKPKDDGLHEEHLGVCRTGSEFRGSEDIDESNKSANVLQEINCDGKKEIIATSEGLLSKLPPENIGAQQNSPVKKHTKKSKSKSSKSHKVDHLAMPSETASVRSPQVITDPQNSGKEANASIFSGKCPTEPIIEEPLPNNERDMCATRDTATFLEIANQQETRHSMEANKEPIEEQIRQVNLQDRSEKHVNLSQNTNVVFSVKESAEANKASSQVVSEFPTKLYSNAEELPSRLSHDNTIPFQNPQPEKHTKKRKRKSSKSHEEAHLVGPHETALVRSSQLTANSHNSAKDTDASIFSGKYPTEPSIEDSLADDERDMSTLHDAASFLEAANKKESRDSMEKNKELILQDSPGDQSKKHVNSDQDTNVDVSLKEPAEARISSQLASESPTKLYFSTDKLKSQSSKLLETKEANDSVSRGSDATKCIRYLNLGEAGYVDAEAEISVSPEKFPFQEQATNTLSILKGADKDCSFKNVDSKSVSKSQRIRKKSKSGSSGICKSTELNGNKDHFNSDNAQVSLNDAQNEPNTAEFIKQADQKANGGNGVDAIIKISSSTKNVPNQSKVSNMNSGNPSISLSNNVSEVSNAFVEQPAEIRVPSLASSEVQAKPRRSRKKSKSELSKLGSQNNCDVLLPKFNGEVTESNDGGPDPSKLANESNQKIELQCMDAREKFPLSDEKSSKLVKVPQLNLSELSNCKLQDLCEQSNAEIVTNDHVTQYEALAGATKSKCDRKKSKKETLKTQVSSEMNEPVGPCRPGDSTIKFDDYFVPREGKHSPAVHAADPPSGKSESRKKNKTGRKTDTNNNSGDAVHDTGAKDSETGTVRKAKNTKQSTERNSSFGRIESDLSLHKAHDKHNNNKKLQNYEPESHVQLSKSGAMANKQGKKVAADGKGKTRSSDHEIDNVVSRDGVGCKDHNSSTINNPVGDAIGSNNFDVSRSEVIATEVASSNSTEDTPNQRKRYKVVRKCPSRKSKKITNNDKPKKSLLVSSDRIFSDASVTNSESENEPYKKKATIKTTLDDLSMSGDSEGDLEEIQTKASAMKLRMDANSLGAESNERGEINKEADGRTKNHHSRRSEASAQKVPLSFILQSSISYRKSKLNALQSEFPDDESQPIDVVLETQPGSAAP